MPVNNLHDLWLNKTELEIKYPYTIKALKQLIEQNGSNNDWINIAEHARNHLYDPTIDGLENMVRSLSRSGLNYFLISKERKEDYYNYCEDDTGYSTLFKNPCEYCIDRKIKTVYELWDRWFHGTKDQPSIYTMEVSFGARWRLDRPSQQQRFMREKRVIYTIAEYISKTGNSTSEALAIAEEIRLSLRPSPSLYNLFQVFKQDNDDGIDTMADHNHTGGDCCELYKEYINDPTLFKFSKDTKTVQDLYNEWFIGSTNKPPVAWLQKHTGARWRPRSSIEHSRYFKYKKVIEQVEKLIKIGYSVDQAVDSTQRSCSGSLLQSTGRRSINRAPPHVPKNVKPIQFAIKTNLQSIHELWKEWFIGTKDRLCVCDVESKYGNSWRAGQSAQGALFLRHKTIINAIQDFIINQGNSVSSALDLAENIRLQVQPPTLHGLYDRINLDNKRNRKTMNSFFVYKK